MTEEQKEYIEENIDLMEDNEWSEFFENAPSGIGGVLYEAGIDWMSELGYIPKGAFFDSNTETIYIPDGVTAIDNRAFHNCKRLESINIPDSVISINYFAFGDCSSLTSINIGNGVISISSSAFTGCTSLTSITIPDSVTSIGGSAFYNCTGLESITFGKNSKLTSIGNYAFYGCSSLTSIIIPSRVTRIGEYTFSECTDLTSVTIPHSVISIQYSAFGYCDKIKINYDGTVAEWKHLIGNNNKVFVNTTYTCTCTDGIVRK